MSLKQPEKIRVDFDDLEPYGQTAEELYAYQGKLFSGYAVYDYFPNSTDIEFEKELKNGRKIGWENTYHPNGQLAYESLCVYATSLEFYEYDLNGTQINGGRIVTDSAYQDMVERYKLLE